MWTKCVGAVTQIGSTLWMFSVRPRLGQRLNSKRNLDFDDDLT